MKSKLTFVLNNDLMYHKVYEQDEKSYEDLKSLVEDMITDTSKIEELHGFTRNGSSFPIDSVYFHRSMILSVELKRV